MAPRASPLVASMVCAFTLALTSIAAAQDPVVPPPPSVAETGEDPAWELFRDAFVAEVDGQPDAAARRLRELRARFPEHPAARLAESVLQRLEQRPAPRWHPPEPAERPREFAPPLQPPPRRRTGERPTGLARAELVGLQTIHGIGLGAEVCFTFDCDDARAQVAVLSVGGGLGLGLSLALTGGGVEPGYALLLNSATVWGFWNGLAFYGVAEGLDDADESDWVPAAGVGQALGLGGGLLLWRVIQPTAGQVSLANTVGIWSGVLTLLAMGAVDFNEVPESTAFLLLTLASDFGLLGGALLSSFTGPVPRGRALVIDAGGVVGMLGGMGVAVLASGDDVKPAGFFLPAMLGTAAGLGLTAFFTRAWTNDDEEAPEVTGAVLPMPEGGAMVTIGARR
ncbi:MAG: hypothetical protein IT379_19840 [Deltaproteobacteria bacterium]|nr:hypothetical protein [Deltaproteobacteria bacterium]